MTEAPRPAGLPWARLPMRGVWPLAESLSRGLAKGAEIALGVPNQRSIPDAEPLGSFGGRRLPRGLAISSEGRIFFAHPERREILTALVSDGASPRPEGTANEWPFVPLWPARPLPQAGEHCALEALPNPAADPYTLVRPIALALAPNGDLVIADGGRDHTGRVMVLALPQGTMRHVIPVNEPVAISFDARGWAYVADADAKTILRFDRSWRRDPDYPHASVPPLEGLTDIAHTHDGTGCGCGCCADCGCASDTPYAELWFLARGKSHALTREGYVWSGNGFADPDTLPTVVPPEWLKLTPPALALPADGALFWKDPAFPARAPLALPGFKVDRSGRLAGTSIPLLARSRRIELPRAGTAQFLAFEGEQEGFTWDRVVLDARIPERTRLLISTATSDVKLEEQQIENLPDSAWSAALEIGPADPPEVLVQSAPGRYLWLRIDLFGDGARTPRIFGIDIFAPRRSSLADLPAPFREDPESAQFLDRFLSYFDTIFAEVTAKHSDVAALFGAYTVPSGPFLDWLASWFDIGFLPEWSDETRRAMVARAIAMSRRRGTVAGLRQILQWHTGLDGAVPAIIEHFRIKIPTSIAGAALVPTQAAHTFTIVLPAAAAPDDKARSRLGQLIRGAIPAHTRYDLRLVRPGIIIGRQSTPGVDMLIGSTAPQPLGEARLGADALFPAAYSTAKLAVDRGEHCPC